MYSRCEGCDHDPDRVQKANRQELRQCGVCGNTFCAACLRQMAEEKGMAEELVSLEEGEAFMLHDAESGDDVCPECWEA